MFSLKTCIMVRAEYIEVVLKDFEAAMRINMVLLKLGVKLKGNAFMPSWIIRLEKMSKFMVITSTKQELGLPGETRIVKTQPALSEKLGLKVACLSRK